MIFSLVASGLPPQQDAVAGGIGLLDAAILGLIEGVTEFLPISSTGHLIVAGRLLGVHEPAFEIAIQGGAITAIVALYWRRLWASLRALLRGGPTGSGALSQNLLTLLLIAAVPAAVLGLLFEGVIDPHLFRPTVVMVAMIVGGVLLIALEWWLRKKRLPPLELERMRPLHALLIGLFQCLALIPGTSRSGATIAGGLIMGFSRPAAAEFSFLVGLPILYGACVLKLFNNWDVVSGPLLPALLVATATSFVSALLVVGPFVYFLRRHTFLPFAVYRIAAGLLLAVMITAGWLVD